MKGGYQRDSSVLIGQGQRTSIRAMGNQRGPTSRHSQGNKTITGVFITRLDPSTTEHQISQHIKKETGMSVRAEKLATKYPSYSSFHIRGDRYTRDCMLEPSLWPSGALIKLFHS